MKHVTVDVGEAGARLEELVADLAAGDVILVSPDGPVARIISEDRFDGLLDRLEDLRDALEIARDPDTGTVPLEVVVAELEGD